MTRCRLFAQWRWGSWERKDNVNVTFGGFRSSRMGIELEFTWNLSPRLGASPNLRSFPRPRAPITEQALLHPGGRPQLCVCIFFFFFFFLFWPPPGQYESSPGGILWIWGSAVTYAAAAACWILHPLHHTGNSWCAYFLSGCAGSTGSAAPPAWPLVGMKKILVTRLGAKGWCVWACSVKSVQAISPDRMEKHES